MRALVNVSFRPSLLAESALSSREVAESAKKIDLAKIRPEGLHEVELAVRRLPQHEVTDALFTRGANDEVGVRLPARVEVLADELRGEQFGKSIESSTITFVRLHNRAHGISNLAAATVSDRKVDVQTGVGCRALLRFRQPSGERLG